MKLILVVAVAAVLMIISVAKGQQAVDSLKKVLKETDQQQPTKIDLLNEIAFRLRRSHQDTAVKYAKTALQLAEQSKYYQGVGTANVTLSVIYHTRSIYEKSLQHALTAVKAFEEINDKKGLMDSYLMLGIGYSNLKNNKAAEEYLALSLKFGRELNNKVGIARAYSTLGHIALSTQPDSIFNEKARELFTSALESIQGYDKENVKINILANLGWTYLLDEKPLVAKPFLEQAMKLALELKDPYAQVYIHFLLGKYHISLRNMEAAEQQLLAGERLAITCGDRTNLLAVYRAFVELKAKTGREKELRWYESQYNTACDSLFRLNLTQQMAELELYHETSKKESTIQLLQRERQIETLWRNFLIGAVLMTVIALAVVFRLHRLRSQKARELLKTQKALNYQLQEVDRVKSNFFANISHEFRTPLTLILAPLEEEIKKRSKEDKGPLQLVMRNANRLLELVNQLLDLSKLEAGKMQMQVSQGNILNFCNALASSFDSLAQQKQIKFEKKISLPHTAWFDSDKLEKVLTNLLANAFKFTPVDGTVTLSLESKQDNEKISISVSDTGKGIPRSEQEKVFSAFYQVKQTTDSHEVGTGLGLSLVRELVRIYGGNISLESIERLGTVFNVELPIAKKAFSQEQINENISQSIAKPSSNISVEIDHEQDSNAEQVEERDSILIVEDNADLRDYMRSILKKEFNILTANDGHQGLAQAVKDVPSLVLTDLMMPDMDGMELTEKLKTNEATSHIPVIMLTARNEHKTKIQGLKTGADDYLTKPFSIEELMARVINLISIRKKLAQRYREHVPVPVTTFQDEPSLDDKFLIKVREVVEKNLHDTSFSVEKLAEEVFLSRTQLLRKLKALTSLSPTDFIKEMRLQKAAHLIRQKSDTITQIGYSVGFNDQSYFTKCFKKEFGLTPSEYSNQVKQ